MLFPGKPPHRPPPRDYGVKPSRGSLSTKIVRAGEKLAILEVRAAGSGERDVHSLGSFRKLKDGQRLWICSYVGTPSSVFIDTIDEPLGELDEAGAALVAAWLTEHRNANVTAIVSEVMARPLGAKVLIGSGIEHLDLVEIWKLKFRRARAPDAAFLRGAISSVEVPELTESF